MADSLTTIRVVSRLLAEACAPEGNEVCISITNPRQAPAALEGWQSVLRLGFHDTHQPGGNFTTMSFQHACALIDFCSQHRTSPMTIHCEAGASRSVAAGLFVAAWLNRPLELVMVDLLNPNPWVIRQLRLAAIYRSIQRRDGRLLKIGVLGPMPFRFDVLPPSIAQTYLD